jgi:hypothetical protein
MGEIDIGSTVRARSPYQSIHKRPGLRLRKQARLRCMPTQAAVLPKGTITQDPARHR